jgi:hypothetical protein
MVTQASQSPESESSTLAPADPVIKRLRALTTEIGSFVLANGSSQQKRMQRVLTIIIDESMEELMSLETQQLGLWLVNMARVVEWCGTGNLGILPPELIPFACQVEGISLEELAARINAVQPDEDMTTPEAELHPAEIEA